MSNLIALSFKRAVSIGCIVWLFLGLVSPALAETFETKFVFGDEELTYEQLSPEQKVAVDQAWEGMAGTDLGDNTVLDNVVSCFDYYTFNSVQVAVSPVLTGTVAGEKVSFKGDILNENPYPIVDATVYAKVFRIPASNNNASSDLIIHRNGYPMVDFVKVADKLRLPANGSIPASFDWQVPAYAGGGKYQVVFYVTASDRFNLLGLTFTDDVAGNSTEFNVTAAAGIEEPPAFNKYSVTLNDEPYEFAAWPKAFNPNEPVTIKAELYNPATEARTVEVKWTLYSWDSLRQENVKDTKRYAIDLKPGESQTVSYQMAARDHAVSYVLAEAAYKDAKSVMNVRFTNEGVEQVRLNFPGIKNYPLVQGEENTLFSCVHAVTGLTENNTLNLTLKDMDGQVIHSYTYEGGVTGDMMGVVDTFTPAFNYGDFDLVAVLSHAGQEVDRVTIPYRCADYPGLDCSGASDSDLGWLQLVSGLLGLLVLIVVGITWWRRRRLPVETLSVLLLLAVGLGVIPLVYAQETSPDSDGDERNNNEPVEPVRLGWHYWESVPLTLINNNYIKSVIASGQNYIEANVSGFVGTKNKNSSFTITLRARYRAQVNKEDGATLSVGDTINVTLPRDNNDIDWFGQFGYSYDSPYGCWEDQQVVWGCANQSLPTGTGSKLGVDLPVLSPTIVGTGAISCSGSTCTANSAGAGSIEVRFPTNAGRLNIRRPGLDALIGQEPRARLGTISIPAKSVKFNYTVTGNPSQPPAPPTMTCPSPLMTGAMGNFRFRGEDPDGDQLYYQIDWNNDGVVDRRLPTAGYVPSGTTLSTTYSWPAAGTYTVKARAVDENNSMSAWASCSVTITTQPTPPTVDLTANPTTVPVGTASTLSWTVRNATTCFASGGWSGQRPATDGNEPTAALQSRTVFQLSCSGPGGSAQDTAVVNITNGPPTPTIPPVITSCDNYVNRGDVVCIDWNTTSSPPPSCVLSGPGLAGGAPSAVTGRVNVTIEKESTYRITCPGGIDEATVHILPIIQET